jgi:DUF1009 family protein
MMNKKVALFAGALRLPFLVRDCLCAQGYDVFVVGLKDFYDPKLNPDLVIRLGGAGIAARACKRRGIKNLIFVGALGHPNLSNIWPDFWSLSVLLKVLKHQKGHDNMATAFANGIEAKGYKIIGAQDLCPDLTFQPGVQTKIKPSAADKKMIDRAVRVSRVLGAEDIGMSVVVDKTVLAVEAAEGTAEMLKRVIAIKKRAKNKKPSGVFAKMTKPGQDLRIDIPAIGADTVRDAVAAHLRGIVVDAGTCFVIDRSKVVDLADKHRIFIVAV